MRIFLKLGGSLITDKDKPYTAKTGIIKRIAREVYEAMDADRSLELLLGHGSGSFGHYAAKDYGTRGKVSNQNEWLGFQKVWYAAHSLNQIVIEEFHKAGLPVISLPPSAAITTANRKITSWETGPIQSALNNHLIPVIYGDVIFDEIKGGIIFSTEDLFRELISTIKPDLILLAGREKGIWKDFPENTNLISLINSDNYNNVISEIKASASVDVTGGMTSKVQIMMDLVHAHNNIQVRIFSGEQSGNILKALSQAAIGTTIIN